MHYTPASLWQLLTEERRPRRGMASPTDNAALPPLLPAALDAMAAPDGARRDGLTRQRRLAPETVSQRRVNNGRVDKSLYKEDCPVIWEVLVWTSWGRRTSSGGEELDSAAWKRLPGSIGGAADP